jgi:hypothetical protein
MMSWAGNLDSIWETWKRTLEDEDGLLVVRPSSGENVSQKRW